MSNAPSRENPRELRLSEVTRDGDGIALDVNVHDRWVIPRELLRDETTQPDWI